MSEKQKIYDELCIVLTEYEEHGWEYGANILYDMLVKIQNNWETVITVQED